MRIGQVRRIIALAVLALVPLTVSDSASALGDEPATGPKTESRFPPLIVPPGFKATLFACDPLIEYPSVIALGPRAGSVFVAHDYLTGLGTEITRRDEIRLVADTDGDGYADKSTLFADGFNSLQGLAYHAGTVFAMHAPLLTALRDTDGDGKADERRDLLTGLGLLPENNPTRLHCANGVAVGHDGWLYLAMGDNGTDVVRPEGDLLFLKGGGILRCRPDGKDSHVFATGLRNIYDIALDEESNVFVRDNENDGGDYMLRVCHSFHGADHGYPYLYYERPAEALTPLADLGRGSSAGGVCYLETAFPPEFRGNLFFCEWGKSVVRYERQRAGSSFAPMKEIEFAAGAPTDPYGFKPTDVIVDRDGSLLVSDWCDGQRPKRGRGRLYRISYVGRDAAKTTATLQPHENEKEIRATIAQLDAPSYHARVAAQEAIQKSGGAGLTALKQAMQQQELGVLGRLHAVWIMARAGGREELADLFALAETDPDARVRATAVRAIADLTDEVLVKHLLDTGRGDVAVAARLAALAKDQDPRVVIEIVVALGRLRWSDAPNWLCNRVTNSDAALAHAAMQTLRRADNWPAVLELVDESDERPIREIALRALADRAEPVIVDGLLERLQRDDQAPHRQQYADLLTRVRKKLFASSSSYWGYRPSPRPVNSETWERTDAITAALDRVLADPDHNVRVAILRRMQREEIPVRLATVERWLHEERDADRVTAIIDALAKLPTYETRSLLKHVIQTPTYSVDQRRAALMLLNSGIVEASERTLLELASRVEDGPVLVTLLGELGQRPKLDSHSFLLGKFDSASAEVRAAALTAAARLLGEWSQRPKLDSRTLLLGKLDALAAEFRAAELAAAIQRKVTDVALRVPAFLKDSDDRVRTAAVFAVGSLNVKESAGELLLLTSDKNAAIRAASLHSLRKLRVANAVTAAVAALEHSTTQLAAIEYLAEFGAPEHADAVTAVVASNRSSEILSAVVQALANWESREPADSNRRPALQSSIANVQGQSGVLLRWQVVGPIDAKAAAAFVEQPALLRADQADTRSLLATGADARIEIESADHKIADRWWLAFADVSLAEPTRAQFLASSNSTLQVWLNGRAVHRREKAGAFQADSDRFAAELTTGVNRVVVQLAAIDVSTLFHVRFRPLSSSAEHERLTQFALQNTGDVARGKAIFLNAEKSLCLKCHRLDDQGGGIGPNLTGVGGRFSRIHLIESILEPSRTIAPSYESISLVLESGRVLTGVKAAEDEKLLTLGDDKGDRHEIPKSEIEERIAQRRSTMPDGLEKRFTDRELLDLLTFLLAEKKPLR